jgi:hypothetical protein
MRRLFVCLLCALAASFPAGAHTLDQYLQVARISVEPDGVRVELRLTPGAQVADRIFAAADIDGDGEISFPEEQAYARHVSQDVALEIDGRRTPLAPTGVRFPSRQEMFEGVGAIRIDFAAETALGAAGGHQVVFRNDHMPELGVYLANALVPSTSEIKITGQSRDALQRELRINIHTTPAVPPGGPRWASVFVFFFCLASILLWRNRFRMPRAGEAETQCN